MTIPLGSSIYCKYMQLQLTRFALSANSHRVLLLATMKYCTIVTFILVLFSLARFASFCPATDKHALHAFADAANSAHFLLGVWVKCNQVQSPCFDRRLVGSEISVEDNDVECRTDKCKT